MFEFSRELKRLFTVDGPRDGLTAGQTPLLELLDLNLLRNEARSADIAAGRISAKDPAMRSLEAARVWRELSRRTGDPVALRKSAQIAERAAESFQREGRMKTWALARVDQALIAMTGADMFGDDSLTTAADFALKDVRKKAPASVAAALAWGRLTRLETAAALRSGTAAEVMDAARAFDGPLASLEALLRNRSIAKGAVLDLRCDRAELLLTAGARLHDAVLLQDALDEADAVLARMDSTYEPISWVRVQELRGCALVALGETRGEIERLTDGVAALADAIDVIGSHHSPMDWARLQHALGLALRAMGEAGESERAFDQALSCFDRALWVLKDHPALTLRAAVANNRAACLARQAEFTGDLAAIDIAVAALKTELSSILAAREPVVWAVCQVNLARLYETRMVVRGVRPGEVASAAMALSSALDVFGEHGLRSLADEAARGLERLVAQGRAEA
jgi:tetratricopeptide (TPR) repeat protein